MAMVCQRLRGAAAARRSRSADPRWERSTEESVTVAARMKMAVCLPEVVAPQIRGGGHLNTIRFAELMGQHCEVRLVSYRAREEGVWFLPDCAARLEAEGWVLLLTWGPQVTAHLAAYGGRLPIVYYQQSLDWGIRLPPGVPVVSMSRYMLAEAQKSWPASPQFYLPPVLPPECRNAGGERDVDVLMVSRKQPSYVCETLVPRLQDRCRMQVLDRFVPRTELYELFNRSKVYLYAFAPQRSRHAPTGWRLMEGIATQTLEAMVCGCTVASDLRGGHADFIEPAVHGLRLTSYSPQWDVHQILNAAARHPQPGQGELEERLLAEYGEAAFHRRADRLLELLADFFGFAGTHPPDPSAFAPPPPITRRRRAWEDLRALPRRLKRCVGQRCRRGHQDNEFQRRN